MEKRYCKDNGFLLTSGRKFFQRRCKKTHYPLKNLFLVFFIGKISIFVYLPRRTIIRPLASGSSVPVWPIFFSLKMRRSLLTASKLVIPEGLFSKITPSIATILYQHTEDLQTVFSLPILAESLQNERLPLKYSITGGPIWIHRISERKH